MCIQLCSFTSRDSQLRSYFRAVKRQKIPNGVRIQRSTSLKILGDCVRKMKDLKCKSFLDSAKLLSNLWSQSVKIVLEFWSWIEPQPFQTGKPVVCWIHILGEKDSFLLASSSLTEIKFCTRHIQWAKRNGARKLMPIFNKPHCRCMIGGRWNFFSQSSTARHISILVSR